MKETRVFTGAPWEKKVGYCRAIRKGSFIAVSGTTAPGDSMYKQSQGCFQIIEKALKELGSSLQDVVRTRIFTTDITKWEEIARAHFEAVGAHPPAASMYQISALIDPKLLVEIEVDAIMTAPTQK